MPHALWAKAPLVLLRHRAVLLAMICASCLLAMAAASAPLLRAGAESEALKGKLAELTPLAAGLTIQTRGSNLHEPEQTDRARRAAAERLARATPFVEAPVLTTMADAEVGGKALEGGLPLSIIPMARTNATAHVERLRGGGDDGAWIAPSIEKIARVGPGGTLELVPSGSGARRPARVHVAAVYRQLDDDLDNPYWVNFALMIRPRTPDSATLPTFLLLDQSELYRVANGVGSGLTNVYELPLTPRAMTPARAKDVAKRFAEIRRRLSRPSSLSRDLGCEHGCSVTSSVEAAVVLAAQSAEALTAVISLLTGFAVVIAIGAAFVAGSFNVRRRNEEARLSVVGGESRAAFAARSAIEAVFPVVVGAAVGTGIALSLVRVLTPDGTVDRSVASSSVLTAAAGAAVALVAVALGAGAARGPTIERKHARRRLLAVPWELPFVVAAAVVFGVIAHGGGLVKNPTIGSHPRLVVLLFPLLVAAAAMGLAVRLLRRGLRAFSPRGTIVFLAIRRLSAARALLILLTVTATVSFAALTFAEVLRESLTSNSAEKAYVANGSDVQGVIDLGTTLPRNLPFAAAKVEQSIGAVRLDADSGPAAELFAVDPQQLIRVIHWRWAGDPAGALRKLSSSDAALPAVAVGRRAASAHDVWIAGKRLPIDVVATADAFPGQVVGQPLLVVPASKLARASQSAGISGDAFDAGTAYVWARGDPRQIEAVLARPPIDAVYLTSVEHFLQSAELTTAARTYGFLRVIAVGAAAVSLIALLLYFHARSRSQLVTRAFLTRMGLSASAQSASLALEAAALVTFALVVGGTCALLTSEPLISHVDPLPQYAPAATVVVPWLLVSVSFVLLVACAAAAGALIGLVAGRGNVGEALRVA